MHTRCLINGEPGDSIAVSDRGLLYGDGLFETLAVQRGVCEFWDRHIQRLLLGCERLRIPAPAPSLLKTEAARLSAGQSHAVLKIIITRGSGGSGYQPPLSVASTRMLLLSDWRERPAENSRSGVQLRVCHQRLSRNTTLAGIKHLNRLEQVLARSEWNSTEIAEGLMLDEQDQVIEGTFTNLFLVEDGQLITPAVDQCGVAGVLRGLIFELASACGIAYRETTVPRERLMRAQELFITNSLIGIWPVCVVEQQRFLPGAVTRQLQQALLDIRRPQEIPSLHG